METARLSIGSGDLNTEELLRSMKLHFEFMDDSTDVADRKRARGESSSPSAVVSIFY